ncbi:MAG: bifunctional riboflavin kinase/FAD synthetase [Myxococcaceae bacterium]
MVAIGNFDGLHLGHQALLQKTIQIAKKSGQSSIAYTFTPHPRKAPRLMSDAQKAQSMRDLGIDRVVFQEFTPEFSALSPADFIKQILINQLQISYLVVGPNFAFGTRASGDIAMLRADRRFETHVVEPVMISGEICSSSLIREAILSGNLDKAKAFLGRSYSLTGEVVKGAGRGQQLGFPTANLQVEQEIIPPLGVYVTHAKTSGRGATNIGRQPTFGASNPVHVETHFLDFKGSLYGQEIEIFFERKIRDEKKFDSAEALKKQIRQDLEMFRI